MKIKKILVTQQQTEAEKWPYNELATKNNVKIDFRPFINIEGITSKEFRQTKIDILEHGAVVFTSKTAIDHYFRMCEELRLSVPDSMKYFCITENIAFYLQKYIIYRKRKIFYGKCSITDLEDSLMKHKEEKYLIPLSNTHKDDVPRALDKMKINYTRAILYKTVSSNITDLGEINYDILVFYSPSGIKSLLENFPKFKQKDIKIASFGSHTAKAIKEAGLRIDIQVPAPEAPSMTMALEMFIKSHNKTNGKK